MDTTNFVTENGFEYQYLPKQKTIIFNNPYFHDKTYYKKREMFLRNNGMTGSFKPRLNTNYDPHAIESNLANLRMMVIEVTDGCNLACEYCGYGKLYNNYDQRANKKLNFDTVKVLIDYLYKLWMSPLNVSYNNIITIGFYGGEPLLSFDIIQKTISYIESLEINSVKFQYNMTTNGMLLNKCMDFLVEKDFSLLLSLDGNKLNNSYRITKNGRFCINKCERLKTKYSKLNNKNEHGREYHDRVVTLFRQLGRPVKQSFM